MHAILFDMDGVLVDVSRSYRRAIEATFEAFVGRPVADGAVQALKDEGGFNDDWKTTHELVRRAGCDVPFEAVVEAFQRRYKGAAAEAGGAWDGLIRTETPLVDAATLDALAARARLGVVTGRPRDEAEAALAMHGWTDRFEAVVTLDETRGRTKPDPFPLRLALDALGVAPADAVYVGDLGDDMRAAQAAGVHGLGHVPPYLPPVHADTLRAAGAEAVVTAMADLVAVVDAPRAR